MADRPAWHGHRLAVLPSGESWLSGGERRCTPVSWDGDPWPFDGPDELEARATQACGAQPAGMPGSAAGMGARCTRAQGSRHPARGPALLVLLGLAALVTIIAGRHSGDGAQPAPLPEPPSQVISSLSRSQPVPVKARVGEYIKLRLPDGHSYSTVLEQPGTGAPVVEALTLPGQQPQLRADGTGHAVVEVMAEPTCPQPNSCPDQRKLLGGLDVTVTP